MGALDFLFPKRCANCKKIGEYICTNCFAYLSFNENSICLVCNKSAINGLTHPGCRSRYSIDGSFSSIKYNPIAKKLIYSFKYKPYLSDLHSLLSELFYEGLIQNEVFAKYLQGAILVPIPLHSSKLRKRGYNQAEILAKGLSLRLGVQPLNLLARVKNTKIQYNLNREKRIVNMKSAFALKSNVKGHLPAGKAGMSKVRGSTILLVDDILTSGSTLLEAANVLKRAGVKRVFGITLAREQ
ncbi:MAG: ComF family protein [Candidatus Levyibacteriota bacterium]